MDHVEDLEHQLVYLTIIQGCECVIDRSYSEMVQVKCRWVTTRNGCRQRVQKSPRVVPLDNRYAPLDTVVLEDWSGESNCGGPVCGFRSGFEAQSDRVIVDKSDRAIVIGDSLFRGTDRKY